MQKQILFFVGILFCDVLCGCHFPSRIDCTLLYVIFISFQESHTYGQRSAKVGDKKKAIEATSRIVLWEQWTYFFPVDQVTKNLYVFVPNFQIIQCFHLSPRIGLLFQSGSHFDTIPGKSTDLLFLHPFSIDEHSWNIVW